MKTALFFLPVLLITLLLNGCATGFHRQKYTDFGHVRGMRFKAASTAEPLQQTPVDAVAGLLPEDQPELLFEKPAAEISIVETSATDSLPTKIDAETDPLPVHAIAAVAQPDLSDTLSKPPLTLFGDRPVHNKGFLVAGFMLVAVSIIYFAMAVSSPVWLTTAVILLGIGIAFVLLAHARNKPGPETPDRKGENPQPEKQEPVEGNERFTTLAGDIRVISLLAYILLLVFLVSTIVGLLFLVPWLAYVAGFSLVAGVPMLLAAVLKGSRYKKMARKNNYRVDKQILHLHRLNCILLAVFFVITILAILFLLLVTLVSWS